MISTGVCTGHFVVDWRKYIQVVFLPVYRFCFVHVLVSLDVLNRVGVGPLIGL